MISTQYCINKVLKIIPNFLEQSGVFYQEKNETIASDVYIAGFHPLNVYVCVRTHAY